MRPQTQHCGPPSDQVLWLADPPHIEDSGQPTELLLTPGTPMELLCEARGTPPPNITWHKDGRAINGVENSSRAPRMLHVQAVQVLCWVMEGVVEGRETVLSQGRLAGLLQVCNMKMCPRGLCHGWCQSWRTPPQAGGGLVQSWRTSGKRQASHQG